MKYLLIAFSLLATAPMAFGDAQSNGEVIEFHIKKGTGSGPWNLRTTPVKVKIGQTLRIINDDDIPHLLHTFNRPCPHQGPESKTGEFYDCEISTTADPDVDLLYDHNFGERSRFYVRATR